MKRRILDNSLWMFLAATLCAASMWIFIDRVLIPRQIHYDAIHGNPRGNLSDLYPRWLGAKELFQRGRDPYSPEFTREAQTGFYGRPLDPDGHGNRNYQQGFYYPLYVTFLLAPTIDLPFVAVRNMFFWGLLCLTLVTIPLWLWIVRWSPTFLTHVTLIIFTIGSLATVQGLKLQQLTLLVAALVAIGVALLKSDYPISAGMVLALATIKPQLVWPLLLWLVVWTLSDWRRRYRWGISFLIAMAILCAVSEWYLPHWLPRFWQAVYEYRSYTGEISVMDKLVGAPWSRVLEVLAFATMVSVCWKQRRESANTDSFALTLSLVLATTVLIVPANGIYNQVLLIPALLITFKQRRMIWHRNVPRALFVITIFMVCWQWIACVPLAGLFFVLPRELVERAWVLPFWTVPQIPVAVVALILAYYHQTALTVPLKPGTS
jgi:hypothetical protein